MRKIIRGWSHLNGIIAWILLPGAILLGLSVAINQYFESEAVNRVGTANRLAGFTRITEAVADEFGQAKADGDRDLTGLKNLLKTILHLRSGIHYLSVYEITPESSSLMLSTDLIPESPVLNPQERSEILAGRSVRQLIESSSVRGWQLTSPIMVDGTVVGAIQGLFSMEQFDQLTRAEAKLEETVALGVFLLAALGYWMVIQRKIHRPLITLLDSMMQVRGGNLFLSTPLVGPTEIQELAGGFNDMLHRIRESSVEKDQLLTKIQGFNSTLERRIAEVTKRVVRQERELLEARSSLERNQRLAVLGELAAAVAHELGNPLNALSGHLQMLVHAESGERAERHLGIIRAEVTRMADTIRQLTEQTRVPRRSIPVGFNSVIQHVLHLVSPELSKQHITVEADLQTDLPPVNGDPHALHGLVMNLVTNAIQAMPTGGNLSIRTEGKPDDPTPGTVLVDASPSTELLTCRLIISDTGIGIAPDRLEQIFEPFFTTRYDQGGTGLGLAICHRVVTDSGGRITVKSIVGEGTTFSVDLPIWHEKI